MFPKRGDRSSARHKEPRRPRGHETISLPAFCRRHLICPSCQSVAGNFACGVGQIRSIFPPVLLPHEGRLADRHERWDKDAVDAFGAKDERANKRTAKSCGLDIPTLISSLRDDDLAGDGGKKARLTRESAKETVKTTRVGNAGCFRCTCGDLSLCAFDFRTQGCGRIDAPGIPCALIWAR